MVFVILGLVLALMGTFVLPKNPLTQKNAGLVRIVGSLVGIVGILSMCFVQINAGEVGVKTLFGKVQEGILTSGLNFVNPLIKVVKFDTKTQNYTMSGSHSEGEVLGDDAISVLSADGLEVKIDLTILFRLNDVKAPDIYRLIGEDYKYKIVRAISRTKIRDNAVYYDAVQLYSTKRDEFQNRINKDIEKEFTKRGLVLENILIRNLNLPQSVKTTIESKINAEQESQKMQFILAKEKQEADRKRVEAQGIADYQKIINSELSDKLLKYEQIKAMKELALSNNSKTILMNGNQSIIIDGK